MSTAKVFYPTRILSSANAPVLLSWVKDSLDLGSKRLLINFQNVMYMDSAGLAALVAARKLAERVNGSISLCTLNGQARMLFELAGMENMFEIYAHPSEFQESIHQNV
ncbi:MAG TPA: STAS domain-containing protein [Crinalium sp.]|jgi:anti-anti-sigma factor